MSDKRTSRKLRNGLNHDQFVTLLWSGITKELGLSVVLSAGLLHPHRPLSHQSASHCAGRSPLLPYVPEAKASTNASDEPPVMQISERVNLVTDTGQDHIFNTWNHELIC